MHQYHKQMNKFHHLYKPKMFVWKSIKRSYKFIKQIFNSCFIKGFKFVMITNTKLFNSHEIVLGQKIWDEDSENITHSIN
jgi:hypothetical protein